AEAVKWYRLAAVQGDATAQLNLGVAYADGKGVRQDYTNAVKYFRLAAVQGDAKAQFNLGVIYANGQGVKKNKTIAKEWFGKACDNGYQAGCDEYRKLNISTKRR
ncbi:MAG: tetratricopeptide repeat protein, partial [Chlorobium sp.]